MLAPLWAYILGYVKEVTGVLALNESNTYLFIYFDSVYADQAGVNSQELSASKCWD